MPICPTCQGEYDRRDVLCPRCKQPLRPGDNVCHICRAQVEDIRLCPRCQAAITAWEREDFSFAGFVIFQGGVLGLFPATVAWLVWFFLFLPTGWSFYHVVITGVSSGLSVLVFVVLYMRRFSWREKRWAAQVCDDKPPPLVPLLIISALLGIMLSALSGLLLRAWELPWDDLGRKAAFMVIYVPAYVSLTMAITAFIIQNYIDGLDQRLPPPLFMNTGRLVKVVVDTVRTIHQLNGHSRHSAPEHAYDVVEAVRIPKDGGVEVLLREWRPARPQNLDPEAAVEHNEVFWRVLADRWGRIKLVELEAHEPYREGGRAFRMLG